MGGFTVYSGLKTVTIPQDQDVKEGDFSINFSRMKCSRGTSLE